MTGLALPAPLIRLPAPLRLDDRLARQPRLVQVGRGAVGEHQEMLRQRDHIASSHHPTSAGDAVLDKGVATLRVLKLLGHGLARGDPTVLLEAVNDWLLELAIVLHNQAKDCVDTSRLARAIVTDS